jgi:hypothetical protein
MRHAALASHLVFAGGTAASMKEFSDRRDDRVFREAKAGASGRPTG